MRDTHRTKPPEISVRRTRRIGLNPCPNRVLVRLVGDALLALACGWLSTRAFGTYEWSTSARGLRRVGRGPAHATHAVADPVPGTVFAIGLRRTLPAGCDVSSGAWHQN